MTSILDPLPLKKRKSLTPAKLTIASRSGSKYTPADSPLDYTVKKEPLDNALPLTVTVTVKEDTQLDRNKLAVSLKENHSHHHEPLNNSLVPASSPFKPGSGARPKNAQKMAATTNGHSAGSLARQQSIHETADASNHQELSSGPAEATSLLSGGSGPFVPSVENMPDFASLLPLLPAYNALQTLTGSPFMASALLAQAATEVGIAAIRSLTSSQLPSGAPLGLPPAWLASMLPPSVPGIGPDIDAAVSRGLSGFGQSASEPNPIGQDLDPRLLTAAMTMNGFSGPGSSNCVISNGGSNTSSSALPPGGGPIAIPRPRSPRSDANGRVGAGSMRERSATNSSGRSRMSQGLGPNSRDRRRSSFATNTTGLGPGGRVSKSRVSADRAAKALSYVETSSTSNSPVKPFRGPVVRPFDPSSAADPESVLTPSPLTTVERRREANARERTRIHTIGAAFEELRRLLPCPAFEQKMSKLSILRISCKYILLLGSMIDVDLSEAGSDYSVPDCLAMLNDVISLETKIKDPISLQYDGNLDLLDKLTADRMPFPIISNP